MSTSLTLSAESFSLSRTSKPGKVTSRGLLGLIISGNKEEKITTGKAMSRAMWECGQFKPILKELSRVFGGKGWDMSMSMLGMDITAPKKVHMIQLVAGIVATFGDAKGEKAIYVDVCKAIVEFEAALDAARIERDAAIEAKRLTEGTPDTVEATAPEVEATI